MEALIKKWGRTPAIRIPATLIETAGLDPEKPVEIREENGRIVIEPSGWKPSQLAALISGIQSEEVDPQPAPEWREIW